jgi:hypothetical protein
MPQYIFSALGLFVVCALLWLYQSEVTKVLDGDFAHIWWVKLSLITFAVPGYFLYMAKEIMLNHPLFFFLALSSATILMGLILGKAWKSVHPEPHKTKFWWEMCRREKTSVTKEWREIDILPPSIVKEIQKSFWWIAPGLMFAALSLLFFLMFFIFSIAGKIVSVALLMVWVGAEIWKRLKWSEKVSLLKIPSLKLQLIELASSITRGSKGMFGFMNLFSGLFISMCILAGVSLLGRFGLIFLAFCSPIIYQIIFWLRLLERFGKFLDLWEGKTPRGHVTTLPSGGLGTFGFSWCCFLIMFLFSVIGGPISSLLTVSSVAILYWILIMYSMRKGEEKVGIENLRGDNYRIPLAVFASLITLFTLSMIFSDTSFAFETLGIGILLFSLFYYGDMWKLAERKYGISKNTKEILVVGTAPFFLLPLVFLIPVLGIVAFAMMCLVCLFFLTIIILTKRLEK